MNAILGTSKIAESEFLLSDKAIDWEFSTIMDFDVDIYSKKLLWLSLRILPSLFLFF